VTSKKVNLSRSPQVLWIALAVWSVMGVVAVVLGGCGEKAIEEPKAFPSPYPAPKVWAVTPLRNETGTTIADGTAMADHLTEHLQQVRGITALPVNRVLEAMAADNIIAIDSPAKIQRLMNTLNVDGLIVGTLTAWDPYDPPRIGVILQLYSRDRLAPPLDTRDLTRAPSSNELPGVIAFTQPVSQVSHHFDAADGTTLKYLRHYATGRVPHDSAAGWRRYLLSIDLYSEFVSHELMRRLFDAEWKRLTTPASAPAPATAPTSGSSPAPPPPPDLN
jgi:hypothetical protein